MFIDQVLRSSSYYISNMYSSPIFRTSQCGSWWLLGSMITSPISLPVSYQRFSIYHFRSYAYSQYFVSCEDSSTWSDDSSSTIWCFSSYKNPYPILYDHPLFDTLDICNLNNIKVKTLHSSDPSQRYSSDHQTSSSFIYHCNAASSFQSCVHSFVDRQIRSSIAKSSLSYYRHPHLSCLDLIYSSCFTHDITNWSIQFPVDFDLSAHVDPDNSPTWILGISSDFLPSKILPLQKLLFYHSYQCNTFPLPHLPHLHCTLLGRSGLFVCFIPSTNSPLKIHSIGLTYNRVSGSLFLIINSEIKLLLATDFFLWGCKFYPYFATLYPSGSHIPSPKLSVKYNSTVSSLQLLCRSAILKSIHVPQSLPSSIPTDISPALWKIISDDSCSLLSNIDKLPLPSLLKSYLYYPSE